MNYCGKHQMLIGNRLRHLGLWRFVKVDRTMPEMKAHVAAWMAGTIPRTDMDPLVIIMLELQKHVDRVAEQRGMIQAGRGGSVKTCPLCAVARITGDESQDVKSLHGFGQLVLRLFQTNGLVPSNHGLAEIPPPKMMHIEMPRIVQ